MQFSQVSFSIIVVSSINQYVRLALIYSFLHHLSFSLKQIDEFIIKKTGREWILNKMKHISLEF